MDDLASDVQLAGPVALERRELAFERVSGALLKEMSNSHSGHHDGEVGVDGFAP